MDKSLGQSSQQNIIRYNNEHSEKQNKNVQIQPGTNDNSNEAKKKKSNKKPEHHKVGYVPDTNLTLACLVCLCFNLPLGAVAMYLSLSAAKAYRDGDPKFGDKRIQHSVLLSLFSIVTTVLIVVAIVVVMFIQNQDKKDDKRS